MNNRFYRTSFKAIAVVLSVLVLFGTVLSAVAGALMIKSEFHTRSEDSLREEFFGSILTNYNSRIFYDVIEGHEPSLEAFHTGNYFYRVLDEVGEVVAGNYDGRPVQATQENEL